jgi:hypothetical protein
METRSLANLPRLENHICNIRPHTEPTTTQISPSYSAQASTLPLSTRSESVVLDGVRNAFILVKAQARMLATPFIPAIREFLLPELENAWHSVLEEHEGLVDSHTMSRVNEAVGEINTKILFFESDQGRCGPLQDHGTVGLRVACMQDGV